MGKNAIILLNKGEGVTSFDCLSRVKRLVNKKSGHCGTLDKFAHGLMIVLSGSFTHLVPVFMGMDKTYEALIEFGKTTDTLDPEGETIETGTIPSLPVIKSAVEHLKGNIKQVPPAYSAIHVNGKRSYQLARSGDDNLELKPRDVKVYSAEILDWEAPYLRIRLHVSKGTYIRSYARDLGKLCSSCAYVKELYRTSIGGFDIKDAIRYDDSESLKAISTNGIELLKSLGNTYEFEMNDEEAFRVFNGSVPSSLKSRFPNEKEGFVLLSKNGELRSIYNLCEGRIICKVSDAE